MRHSTCVPFLVVLFACPQTSVAPPESEEGSAVRPDVNSVVVAFDVIEEVHNSLFSSIRERRRTVIGTASDWEQFWNEFAAAIMPRPDAPVIDFTARMVIVASMGERATGGYAIVIEEVTEGDKGLTARVVETSPAATCFLTQVVTAPVTAVTLPRSDGTVVFVEETRMQECS